MSKGEKTVIAKDQDRWQAQDDLRTLTQATEIQKDRKRLDAADAEAKLQLEALKKIRRAAAKPRASPKRGVAAKKTAGRGRRRS